MKDICWILLMLSRRQLQRGLVGLLGMTIAIALNLHPWVSLANQSLDALLQQSRQRYEAGQLDTAKSLLQTVQQQAIGEGNSVIAAIALSNLALIHGDQGNWDAANRAIATSIDQLQTAPQQPKTLSVLAQSLNVKSRLQLAQGQGEAAFQSATEAQKLYRRVGNLTGDIQSQLRQAQALQSQGFLGRAYKEILEPLGNQLDKQPDSTTKIWGLRSLGEAISLFGSLTEAQDMVQKSLILAQRLQNLEEVAASKLTLANLLYVNIRDIRRISNLRSRDRQRLQQDTDRALALYQDVAASNSPNRLRAQLNQLALLVDSSRYSEALQLVNQLQPQQLNATLSSDRTGIALRLNLANSLLRLQRSLAAEQTASVKSLTATDNINPTVTLALLNTSVQQAEALNDARLQANALGNLARAQEQQQQLDLAQTTTEKAILTAQTANALDQIYRWLSQLGRLQEAQGDRQGAIASYTQAINTLRNLRGDLLGINSEALAVDQESLEPVHRQLINLLLPKDGSQPPEDVFKRTRDIIESLQLEEINNYLRAACLQSQVAIDEIPVPQATKVVYPMILRDRIAIIVSATGQTPKLYTQNVPQAQVEAAVRKLQVGLRNRISLEYQEPSQQLYQWLITPIEPELKAQQTQTLVFVLDGAFRNIPMSALSDGTQFLIEKYSIASTPGLTLTSPQPLQAKALSGIGFGLSQERPNPSDPSRPFAPLEFVKTELTEFQSEIQPATINVDEQFTREQFDQILRKSQAPIVHLATHGQFSSNRDQTFLLAANGVINIDELAFALGAGGTTRKTAIELLVLSACETATGDDRAPLGLAGMALKSGARSTLASLWKVNDEATSLLMQQFYRELASRQVTKAEALRRAQQSILENPLFRRHPYFWAPFILVGNWL